MQTLNFVLMTFTHYAWPQTADEPLHRSRWGFSKPVLTSVALTVRPLVACGTLCEQIDPKVVNELLQGTTIRMVSGVLGKVRVSIPYTALLNRSIELVLEDVHVELCPAAEYAQGNPPEAPSPQTTPSSVLPTAGGDASSSNSSSDAGGGPRNRGAGIAGAVSEWDAAARDGKDIITSILNRVLSQIRVHLVNRRPLHQAAVAAAAATATVTTAV
jgi:hypothetical protein